MGSSSSDIDALHTFLQRDLTDRQFELLCGKLIDNRDNPDETVVTKRTGDTGLDVWVKYLGEITEAIIAIEAKHHSNRISRPQLAKFQGNLSHRADSLVFMTTSEYTAPSKDYAEQVGMELYNGLEIAELLYNSTLNFTITDTGVTLPDDFWPETVNELFPSKLVPQADNIATLCCTIEAIGIGKNINPEILQHIREQPPGTDYIDSTHLQKEYTIDSDYKSRHPDFYAHAAVLFGFAESPDEKKPYQGNKYQQWHLTNRGERLFDALRSGDDERAHRVLTSGIRASQLTSIVIEQVGGDVVAKPDITAALQKYSGLNETTASRRAQTVKNYIAELPEFSVE